MIHLVITAGGTIEDIDEVRKITNTSTGQMGVALCEAFIEAMADKDMTPNGKSTNDKDAAQPLKYTIHYITTTAAAQPPENDHIQRYFVTDTDSVLDVVKQLSHQFQLDYFIHCMAISDFTTAAIVPVQDLSAEIAEALKDTPNSQWQQRIEAILRQPTSALSKTKKISSKSDLMLSLKKTPKVISQIKAWSPNVCLVGFKLLKNVSEEELLQVATQMGTDNACDFVLANDLQSVQAGKHKGYLLHNREVVGTYVGKQNIAEGIVEKILQLKAIKIIEKNLRI